MSSSANATRARIAARAAVRVSRLLKRRPDAVGSAASGPAIASSTTAQSSALRAIGPILSSVHERAIAPCRLTSPYVGRRPVTPQYAEGVPMEPEVSDPSAYGTRPPPTAEPEPLDEPPDQRSMFQGFRPGPCKDALGYRYPPPPASSTIATFAASTAPARFSFATAVASRSNTWSRYGGAPQVVGAPFAASRSFAPYGMPSSGRRSRRLSAASARFASARARSRMTVATALYRGPTRARRSQVSSASSTAEMRRLRKRFCSSAMVAKRWSLRAGRPSAALSRWERVVCGSRSRSFRPLRAPRPRVERDRRWDACLPAARSPRSPSFAPFLSQNPQDSVIPSVNGVAADAASVSHRRAPAFAARLRHAGRLVGLELGATGADVDHAAAGSGQHGRANGGTVRDDHRVTRLDAHRGGAAALRQDDDADGIARFPTER